MLTENYKPRIMLHIIMPNQVSGPNTASRLIFNSFLSDNYTFNFLVQKKHAGGRINFSLIKDLMKQINEFNPDIIHLSGLQSSGFHGVIAARLSKNKKILIAVRGTSIDSLQIHYLKRFFFGKIIEPVTLKLADSVYTVCEAMFKRRFIQKYSKNLIGFIHNSAPIVDLSSISNCNFRNRFNIDPDLIVVAIVGRLVFDKGVTFIVDAIKKIKNKNIIYAFIGDGPSSAYIEDKLRCEIKVGKVILLGQQDSVISILSECDIFLFATLHENLSNALLEACSLGLAIIATNTGGNPEVITNKYNGILIPTASSESIVKSLLQLANNEDLRKQYGRAAVNTVKNKFSQKILLNKLKMVYTKLLSE